LRPSAGCFWLRLRGHRRRQAIFEKYFLLNSEWLSGWANSCALLGCLAGALASGGLSDKFGRKKLLIVAALLFASSSRLPVGRQHSLGSWCGAFLAGVAIGMTSNVAPGVHRRGRAGPSPRTVRWQSIKLAIFIGFVVGQTANWLIAETMPGPRNRGVHPPVLERQYGWRWDVYGGLRAFAGSCLRR